MDTLLIDYKDVLGQALIGAGAAILFLALWGIALLAKKLLVRMGWGWTLTAVVTIAVVYVVIQIR
jgi:hypothetical protein